MSEQTVIQQAEISELKIVILKNRYQQIKDAQNGIYSVYIDMDIRTKGNNSKDLETLSRALLILEEQRIKVSRELLDLIPEG